MMPERCFFFFHDYEHIKTVYVRNLFYSLIWIDLLSCIRDIVDWNSAVDLNGWSFSAGIKGQKT